MHILSQDAANIETKQWRQYSSFNIYVFSATRRTTDGRRSPTKSYYIAAVIFKNGKFNLKRKPKRYTANPCRITTSIN